MITKSNSLHGERAPESPWFETAEDVLKSLCTDPDRGLVSREILRRRERYGKNRLAETKKRSWLLILLSQFKSLIVLLLAAASVVSIAFGEFVEAIAVIVVIILNTVIGFFTEFRAVRSMESLARIGDVMSRVLRDGQVQNVEAQSLVPGDIVLIEGGDILSADMRLFQASKLLVDESTFTGESLPVSKGTKPSAEDTILAERSNMLFKGTAVLRGSGSGVITATGMRTELGKISSLVEETEEETTPLEKKLNRLGNKLILVTLIAAAATALSGILAGKTVFLMVETAIALAVAAIPEGLPIVATLALARGMWRMARRNALINRLSAVETLGSTNVIFTDKTGTLTENRMTAALIRHSGGDIDLGIGGAENRTLPEDRILMECLKIGVLCNNASLSSNSASVSRGSSGDPLEIALLAAGRAAGIERNDLVETLPEMNEEAFDADTKMMATYHRQKNRFYVAVKGAPESVLAACDSIMTDEGEMAFHETGRKEWLEHNRELAGRGLRILAFAAKTEDSVDAPAYEKLTFLGLIGLLDPPRSDVRRSIDLCQEAGIRVVMATGDQAVTAKNVALEVGLVDSQAAEVLQGSEFKSHESLSEEERRHLLSVPIFARVSPKQKLDLIDIHQKNGSVVAMTGDGVNDAPALKKADIGIAMGERGTQVAKEASDMILRDDAFSSIVTAIEQGRIIFNNIRKFVIYLLSCNVSEILIVSLASLFAVPLPILPLQILFLNVVTDIFPALALGVGEGDRGIMRKMPRDPEENLLTRRNWADIAIHSTVMTLSVLGALTLSLTWLGFQDTQVTTISFLTLAFSQLWHVFNMRDIRSPLLVNEISRNSFIWAALGLCILLLLGAVYTPGLSGILKITRPGPEGWLLIITMSLIPLLIGQLRLILREFRIKRRIKG